jgi:hypothetical protein
MQVLSNVRGISAFVTFMAVLLNCAEVPAGTKSGYTSINYERQEQEDKSLDIFSQDIHVYLEDTVMEKSRLGVNLDMLLDKRSDEDFTNVRPSGNLTLRSGFYDLSSGYSQYENKALNVPALELSNFYARLGISPPHFPQTSFEYTRYDAVDDLDIHSTDAAATTKSLRSSYRIGNTTLSLDHFIRENINRVTEETSRTTDTRADITGGYSVTPARNVTVDTYYRVGNTRSQAEDVTTDTISKAGSVSLIAAPLGKLSIYSNVSFNSIAREGVDTTTTGESLTFSIFPVEKVTVSLGQSVNQVKREDGSDTSSDVVFLSTSTSLTQRLDLISGISRTKSRTDNSLTLDSDSANISLRARLLERVDLIMDGDLTRSESPEDEKQTTTTGGGLTLRTMLTSRNTLNLAYRRARLSEELDSEQSRGMQDTLNAEWLYTFSQRFSAYSRYYSSDQKEPSTARTSSLTTGFNWQWSGNTVLTFDYYNNSTEIETDTYRAQLRRRLSANADIYLNYESTESDATGKGESAVLRFTTRF